VQIDRQTWQVLHFGQQLRRLSAGAFDTSVAHALVAHGALPTPLSGADQEGEVRQPHGDLELLDEGTVRWQRCGLIDLGGIAKGYAVDCAIGALRRHGATAGLVNAGGDLRCYGDAQPVQVRAPDGGIVSLGELCEGALATSGDSPQPAAGALVDPHSGALARWGASISVVADECMSADALTKIVRLCPTRAPGLLARFMAQAFRLETDGSVCMTAAPEQRQRRLQ
jgi:thiamine biosynthesis lipoprotein